MAIHWIMNIQQWEVVNKKYWSSHKKKIKMEEEMAAMAAQLSLISIGF
jgi:hypothetical protein